MLRITGSESSDYGLDRTQNLKLHSKEGVRCALACFIRDFQELSAVFVSTYVFRVTLCITNHTSSLEHFSTVPCIASPANMKHRH